MDSPCIVGDTNLCILREIPCFKYLQVMQLMTCEDECNGARAEWIIIGCTCVAERLVLNAFKKLQCGWSQGFVFAEQAQNTAFIGIAILYISAVIVTGEALRFTPGNAQSPCRHDTFSVHYV